MYKWVIAISLSIASMYLMAATTQDKNSTDPRAYYSDQEIRDKLIETLKAKAQQINQSTPVIVDGVKLSEAKAGPGLFMTYYFKTLDYPATDIDSKKFGEIYRPIAKENVCKGQHFNQFFLYGGKVVAFYSGNDEILINSFIFDASDCGLKILELPKFKRK